MNRSARSEIVDAMLYPPKNAHTSPSMILMRGPYYFDPLNPDPKAITIGAIAAGLDAEVRFLNQTTRPITVAEHSIRCARIATAARRSCGTSRDRSSATCSCSCPTAT